MSTTAARISVCIIAVTAAVCDAMADRFGWCSLSECVRQLDRAMGGWLRWILLGLWLHFFAARPFGGWGSN